MHQAEVSRPWQVSQDCIKKQFTLIANRHRSTSLSKNISKTRKKITHSYRVSLPTRYENWPNASMKGIDSMSPASRMSLSLCGKKNLSSAPELTGMGTIDQTYAILQLPAMIQNVLLPIVPPSSMTQTSAASSVPSTGFIATRSIHSCISSVMCGTTW